MSAVVLALKAMNDNSEIWRRYYRDFMSHKLKLSSVDPGEEAIAEKVLEMYFGDIFSESHDAQRKVVLLHSYVHIYQLDVSKMAGLFKSLSKIQRVYLFMYTPSVIVDSNWLLSIHCTFSFRSRKSPKPCLCLLPLLVL